MGELLQAAFTIKRGFFFKKSGERKKGNQQGVKRKKKRKKCDVRSGSIERLAGQTERVLVFGFLVNSVSA